MEINSEINKIFGTEMARLFASTITEEEMMETAKDVWNDMCNGKINQWGDRKQPEIRSYIQDVILKRLYEKIDAILREQINDELLEKKAREMVEEARKIGEETIIKDMARHMCENVLSVYNRDEHVLETVINRLRIESNRVR